VARLAGRDASATPADASRSRWGQTGEISNLQFALLLALPVLVFLVLVVAYPLGYAVWLSLHQVQFFGGYRATYVGLDNFAAVIADGKFWWSAWVSLRFTVESVVLAMLIGLGLALTLNRPLRFAGLLRTLVILPWVVSLYGTGIMFAYMAKGQTGIGTALAFLLGGSDAVNLLSRAWVIEVLALGNAWNMAPLVAFFLLANLKTIPQRLYDLAAVDRLSSWQTLWNVTLPPLRFTLFVFTCITTVLSLKLFDFVFVLSGGGPGTASATLTYQIYKTSFKDLDLGTGAAMSFLLLAMIIGSTLLLYLVWGRREEHST
jgi:multiple sugar transport system permease protein